MTSLAADAVDLITGNATLGTNIATAGLGVLAVFIGIAIIWKMSNKVAK